MQRRKASDGAVDRAGAVLMAAVMVVSMVAAGAFAGAAGAAVDGGDGVQDVETMSGHEDATAQFAYISDSSGEVVVAYSNGATQSFDTVQDPGIIGPIVEFDGVLHATYVEDTDGDAELRSIDLEDEVGDETVLADDVDATETHLGVNEDEDAVFYVTDEDGHIKNADLDGDEVVNDEVSAIAVLGEHDLDGDEAAELIYVDESNDLIYDGEETGFEVDANDGLGIGMPADFDRDGELQIPAVDGNNPVLVGADGTEETIREDNVDEIAPVAGADYTGDGVLEIVGIEEADGTTIQAIELDGDSTTVSLDDVDEDAVSESGIAATTTEPQPQITNLTIRNTTDTDPELDPEVTVSFESSHVLDDIDGEVDTPDGMDAIDLALDDFEETENGDELHYRYENASYEANEEGTYEAELTDATTATDETPEGLALQDDVEVSFDAPQIEVTEIDEENVSEDQPFNVTATVTEAPQDLDEVTIDVADETATFDGDGTGEYETEFSLSGIENGTHDVEATVIDEAGLLDTDLDENAVTYDAGIEVGDVTASETTVETDETVDFAVEDVVSETPVDVTWEFDDGATATGESVSHSYDADGTYDATVTLVDEAGNEIEETVTIEVSSPSAGGGGGGGGFDSNVAERDSASIENGEVTVPGSDVATIDFEEHASGTVIVDRLHDVPNEVDEDATLEDDIVEVYDIDAPDQPATIELEIDGVDADDDHVVVQHWTGDEWEELDTDAEREDGTLTVEAETSGFSVFAVTESDAVDDGTEESDETDDTEEVDTEDDADADSEDDETEDADVAGTEADADAGEPADEESDDEVPGFGAVVALTALLAAALVATRRRD